MARSGSDLGDAGLHLCPLCSKQFTRRDLRERHRRRCEKSIGKQRPTKKSSCESCIASKVKCDHSKPCCSRCLARSIHCEYRLDPHPTTRTPASRQDSAMAVATTVGKDHTAQGLDGMLLPLMDPLSDASFGFQSNEQITDISHLTSETTSYHWTGNPSGSSWEACQPETHGDLPYSFTTAALGPDWPLVPNALEDTQLQHDYATGALRTISASTSTSNPGPFEILQDSPQNSQRHSPQVEEVAVSTHASVTSSDGSNERSSVSLSPPSSAPTFTGLSSSLSEPLSLGIRSKSVTKHSDSLSDIARAALSTYKPLSKGTISVDTALKMITEYPKRMLVDSFQSPFVHPKLNRDSPRGMPEPIAIALACVGMKMHAETSGLPFVCNIFRDQKDKLINELPSMMERQEELTAALHAMCIYQIEGLLSDNRYDSKLSPAVLHQEYLVRMTRRLLQRLWADVPEFFTAPCSSNVSWEVWTVHESLRRILFLLMIIHQLLGATKMLDPAYFEPLFPEQLFNNLLLPCDELLWSASCSSEWEDAKRRTANKETDRLGDSLKRLVRGPYAEVRRTSMDHALFESENASVSFEQLPELTKLIVSIAHIKIKDL